MNHRSVFALASLALALCPFASEKTFAQQGPAASYASPAAPADAPPAATDKGPRVYFQSQSKGNHWAAARDQSMEMGKDFAKECPQARVTINQQAADYTIVLNHIEVGWARDNQFQIANRDGDLITATKEGGSINKGVKKACETIMADWAAKK